MRLDRRGIPEKVLTGKVRKYISVHRRYKAVKSRELMKRVNAAFWAKAKGGTDDLGNKWKPLDPKTHAYKPLSPMEKRTYSLGGKRTRGLLTPAQDKRWRRIFARKYNRLVKRGIPEKEAKEKAAKLAWTIVISEGARTKIGLNRITDINIRTGRLVNATRPGTVANNRYYTPKDQVVEIKPRSIRITFRIPYISKVDAVRPVVPDNIDKWHQEAHEIAIVEAKVVYDNLRADEDRKRSTTNNTTMGYQRNRNRRSPRR